MPGAIENGPRRGLARLDINSVINEFASAENGVLAFASSTGWEDSVGPAEDSRCAALRVVKPLMHSLTDSQPETRQPGRL